MHLCHNSLPETAQEQTVGKKNRARDESPDRPFRNFGASKYIVQRSSTVFSTIKRREEAREKQLLSKCLTLPHAKIHIFLCLNCAANSSWNFFLFSRAPIAYVQDTFLQYFFTMRPSGPPTSPLHAGRTRYLSD